MGVRAIVLCSRVVIDDLDVFRAISSLPPFKADAPLQVNPDAVLAFPVAREGLQAVTAEPCQVPQVGCRLENPQPLFGLMTEAFESRDPLTLREAPGLPVSVAPDHIPV